MVEAVGAEVREGRMCAFMTVFIIYLAYYPDVV